MPTQLQELRHKDGLLGEGGVADLKKHFEAPKTGKALAAAQSSEQEHDNEDEGVEVVLEEKETKIIETPPRKGDQNVFRHPNAVRPRPMRAPSGPPHPPPHHLYGSGSWGYAPHHPHEYPPHMRPAYPVPPYNPSGSFDAPHTHYSPHVHYPPPRYHSEDVNVVSPHHKADYRAPMTPRSRHGPPPSYYQYPPQSPVNRPGGSGRLRDYAMRRGEGAYTKAQKESTPEEVTPEKRPPLVAESSFDSEHVSREGATAISSAPPTPQRTPSQDPYHQFYSGGSWGSCETTPCAVEKVLTPRLRRNQRLKK